MKNYKAKDSSKFEKILTKTKRKYGLIEILNKLKPGESFLIKTDKEHNALRQLCYNYGFKVTTKAEGNNRRVWRLQ